MPNLDAELSQFGFFDEYVGVFPSAAQCVDVRMLQQQQSFCPKPVDDLLVQRALQVPRIVIGD